MAIDSKIEWTDATWTPVRARLLGGPNKGGLPGKVGTHCEKVSAGCKNCYAERHNKRMLPGGGTGLAYTVQSRKQVEIFLDEKMLAAPLSWKKPRKIFVCSTTDLFGEFVPFELVDRVFAVMALCPQHTFQVLTKRPERMKQYLLACDDKRPLVSMPGGKKVKLPGQGPFSMIVNRRETVAMATIEFLDKKLAKPTGEYLPWPLPNVWLGTSVEDQAAADKRIPELLKAPAAVRFLSCEPLLGAVDLKLGDSEGLPTNAEPCRERQWLLHWIIAGGESGPGSRPMHPDRARSLRDQCVAAGVAFHFKQWGEFKPVGAADNLQDAPGFIDADEARTICVYTDGSFDNDGAPDRGGYFMERVGKHAAGRELDGRTWDEFPQSPATGVAGLAPKSEGFRGEVPRG